MKSICKYNNFELLKDWSEGATVLQIIGEGNK